MKRITLIISALFVLFSPVGLSQDCAKCNTEELLEFSENIDNLNYYIVKNFICTFDSTCINNIEYSEWSNELVFKLVEKDINLMNKVLHDLGFNYVKLICDELQTPVIDVDIKRIYELIRNSHGPKDIIEEEKKAIRTAAIKEGLEIE